MKNVHQLILVLAVGCGVCLLASAQTKQGVSGTKEPLEAELPLLPGAENLQPLALPVVAEESVPDTGTFWSAQRFETEPPLPFSRFPDLPVYSLGNGQMLVDDRAVDIDLYFEQRELQQMLARAAKGESLDESGGEVLALRLVQNYNGVDLLLDLEDITNGVAAFTIYCPSNDAGYDLFGTTNLSVATEAGALNATNWVWLYRAAGGETNFTVPMTWEAEAYFRLAGTNDTDADGLSDAFETLTSHSNASTNDSDGDSLLDAWEWAHFGNFEQSGTNDVDADGLDNLAEQTGVTDPNELAFTAAVGYGRVNTRTPNATLNVTRGLPYEVAVVVGTNFNGAVWQPFTASPVVSLPDADGPHQVWFALRGRVFTNNQVWQGLTVTLDRVAPQVAITRPLGELVFQPILQVTGWSTDAVWAVSCAVSNATGINTNLAAFVTGQDRGVFVTNRFQCFDVELTNGMNLVAIGVTDLAGNTTFTNLNVTFDPTLDTNAPQLTLRWPKPGAVVGQNAVTLRAWVDDATSVLSATVANSVGTNDYWPLVERNGAVWVDDVAMATGTNWITLSATDAAGNVSRTNFAVIRSSLSVSINQPWLGLPATYVSGTVSEAGHAVWANGVAAVVDGTSWSVPSLPLSGAGPAEIAVEVTTTNVVTNPNTTNNSFGDPSELNPDDPGGISAGLVMERPASVRLVSGEWEEREEANGTIYNGLEDEWDAFSYLTTRKWNWHEAKGGFAEYSGNDTIPEWIFPYFHRARWHTTYRLHPDGTEEFTAWEEWDGQIYTETNQAAIKASYWGGNFAWQKLASGARAWQTNHDYATYVASETWSSRADIDMQLDTGGRGASKRQSVIRLYASAAEVTAPYWGGGESALPSPTYVPGFGVMNSNGFAEKVKPDNITASVTAATSAPLNTQSESVGKYRLEIRGMGISGDISGKTFPVLVGQRISLLGLAEDYRGLLSTSSTNFSWAIPEFAFSSFSVTSDSATGKVVNAFTTNSSLVSFCWANPGPKLVSCRLMIDGQEVQTSSVNFNVLTPAAKITAQIMSPVSLDWSEGYPTLHIGNVSVGTQPGILFSNIISMPSGYTGSTNFDFQWVQKVILLSQRVKTNDGSGAWFKLGGTNCLDSSYPYPSPDERFSDSCTTDSPNSVDMSHFSEITQTNNFRMWLMFKPSGGEWVPLRSVTWGWGGSGTFDGITGIATNTTATANQDESALGIFPEWTDNIVNHFDLNPE